MMLLDLTGERFGRLVAVEKLASRNGLVYWRCICDCGVEKATAGKRLRNGTASSCGCLVRESLCSRNSANARHGMTGTPTWISWDAMIQRCTNSNHKSFKDYGGRGIEVCQAWLSFDAFFADMGERPAETTLDRSDTNGNYEPSNCRWATSQVQGNNKRSSVVIEHNGRAQTLIQWAREAGIGPKTFMYRIKKGWPMKDALTFPIDRGNGHKRGVR